MYLQMESITLHHHFDAIFQSHSFVYPNWDYSNQFPHPEDSRVHSILVVFSHFRKRILLTHLYVFELYVIIVQWREYHRNEYEK